MMQVDDEGDEAKHCGCLSSEMVERCEKTERNSEEISSVISQK